MEMHNQKQMPQDTFKAFFSAVFKHRRLATGFFVAVVATVAVGTFLAPRLYESEAKLFVRLGRETLTQDSAPTGETIMISQSLENQINSEIEVLRSRELAARVVRAIGTEKFQASAESAMEESFISKARRRIKAALSFPKKALASLLKPSDQTDAAGNDNKEISKTVNQLLGSLQAQVVPESNIINLVYESQNPQFAKEVLDQLISIYREKHLELHVSSGSFEFFQKESNKLQDQLQQAEAELEAYKNKIGVGDLEEQRSIVSEQIGTLQRRHEQISSDMAATRARVNALEIRLNELPENVVLSEISGSTTSAVEELQRRINELKLDKQDLLSTFTKNSVPVKDIQRQIDEAEALLKNAKETRQVTTGVNPVHQELKTSFMVERGSLDALQAEQKAIEHQINTAKEELKRLNKAEVQMAKLQRRRNQLEENYRKYTNNMEQLRIDKARETEKISNINIAQSPILPTDPASPKAMMNLALAVFFGLFGALGLPFLMEFLSGKVEQPEEVEKLLELPFLGSISKIEE